MNYLKYISNSLKESGLPLDNLEWYINYRQSIAVINAIYNEGSSLNKSSRKQKRENLKRIQYNLEYTKIKGLTRKQKFVLTLFSGKRYFLMFFVTRNLRMVILKVREKYGILKFNREKINES